MKGTITVVGQETNDAAVTSNRNDKQVTLKNGEPFTNCINEINNTQIDNVKDLDIVMPKSKSIEYSNNYAKASRGLWQYSRDEPNGNNITNSE